MIVGIFHQGSGLGNQLFRYVTTRVIADEKGLPFGMVNPQGFKGASFMDLDMGLPVPGTYTFEPGTGKAFVDIEGFSQFHEKRLFDDSGADISSYDPEINFIGENTIIDGEFQDDKYWGHRLFDINKWLNAEHLGMPNNVCVIGFRGGEFAAIPELFLPKEYYRDAMDRMLQKNYDMRFVCVTDDPQTAALMLPPEVKITHSIDSDWRMIRNAHNLIISNSSFYILPALLNRHADEIIAPRFWARRNTGVWSMPGNYYRRFQYV